MKPQTHESAALRFLYGTAPGRGVLKLLTRPGLSRAAGRFLDAPVSRLLIGPSSAPTICRSAIPASTTFSAAASGLSCALCLRTPPCSWPPVTDS